MNRSHPFLALVLVGVALGLLVGASVFAYAQVTGVNSSGSQCGQMSGMGMMSMGSGMMGGDCQSMMQGMTAECQAMMTSRNMSMEQCESMMQGQM